MGAASRWPAGRLRLRRLDGAHQPTFGEDVRQGLTATPKVLQPKYFYDELGSLLFGAICALPEYPVFRAESEILRARAGEIAAWLPGPVRIVELGSGDARKTRLLIDALLARQGGLDYLPIDVSASALVQGSEELLSAYPNLRVTAWVADYQTALRAIRDEATASNRYKHTLVLFLGSTLGNLEPAERSGMLRSVRGMLNPGDAFLLGLDLKKPESVLIPAYDDPLGVTAAFNLNVLGRINRELGGEFDLRSFRHRARYDPELARIEMHLESLRDQTVPIRGINLEARFAAGETIHTESSHKFDPGEIAGLADEAGMELRWSWFDRARQFSSNLLVAI
ncbi:MAG TPA: L-histidine N(alpha)-methyltransferase [Thermoanaerobaculia bacterium]|jgi:dimethylhistidine N-methyltransferase|nr:L-histidine N(alpha)-methyltransferase [Thermoanaerobaculia bacterium]